MFDYVLFLKQKTAYEWRISDWSSDVCSSDLPLMDSMSAAVKKMIAKAKERGYVTYDELNAVLPPTRTCASAVGIWLCVPTTSEARPSRKWPSDIFSLVASPCTSTTIACAAPPRG